MAVLRFLGCSSVTADLNSLALTVHFPTNSLPSEKYSDVPSPQSSSVRSGSSLHDPSPEHLPATGSKPSAVSSVRTQTGPVHSLAVFSFSVLAGTASGELLCFQNAWNLSESEPFASTSGRGSVKAIVVSAGKIFTAHQDGRIRVWEGKESFQRIATLPTASDRAVRYLLPRNHVQIRRHRTSLWINHVDAVSALAVRGDLLYSVSWDRTLKIWLVSDFRCIESVRAHDDAINALCVSGDGTVYTGSADTQIRVWTKPNGHKRHSLVATLDRHRSAVNALALSPDGSVLYSGACDRSILVWRKEQTPQHMAVIGALRGHKQAVLCLAFAAELLVSGSADQTVRVWQRDSDQSYSSIAVLDGHDRPVKSLAVTTESTSGSILIYSGSLDGEVKAWRISKADVVPNSKSIRN